MIPRHSECLGEEEYEQLSTSLLTGYLFSPTQHVDSIQLKQATLRLLLGTRTGSMVNDKPTRNMAMPQVIVVWTVAT